MAPIGTKNLGLIKAIFVGVNPPLNTKVLWFNDSINPYTTGPAKVHYYYDVIHANWYPLLGGSSAAGGVIIPQPELFCDTTNTLRCTYYPSNLNFLNYNPEVWLFRWRFSKKKKEKGTTTVKVRASKAGYRHVVHLDGTKHTGNNMYSGGTTNPIKRTTEWTMNPEPYSLTDVIINYADWVKLPNSLPYSLSGGAIITANISGGAVTGYTVVYGGTGYTSAPTVHVIGVGTGATGTAVLTGGVVTSVTLGSGGTGYTSSPEVKLLGGGGDLLDSIMTVLPKRKNKKRRRVVFKFAIAINNPDTGDLQHKKVFGPLSAAIVLQPIYSKGNVIGFMLKHDLKSRS